MRVKELKAALRVVPGDAHVVFCANPGPGQTAINIIGAMETTVNVTENERTEQQTVIVLVGNS